MGENVRKTIPEIVIDDGYLRIPVRNLYGDDVGVFYFNPTDVGIAERYNEVAKKLPEITAPLEHINIRPDGTVEDGDVDAIETMRAAKERLYETFDYLLGGNMSEAFFGKTHPFSPVGGYFYCERALEAVGKVISAQHEVELKKVNKRLERYTQGYANNPNRAQRRNHQRRKGS